MKRTDRDGFVGPVDAEATAVRAEKRTKDW